MNILFVVQHYYPEVAGGAGRSVQTLAENLLEKGHSVTVVRSHSKKKREVYTHNGVKVYALPVRNIYYYEPGAKNKKGASWKKIIWHAIDIFNPFAMWDFKKVLDEVKPDIVNTNTLSGFSTGLFYVVKWKGIRLVHTMRDYYLMCPQSSMYKAGHSCDEICSSCKPFAAARRHMAKQVDIFLSNSQFVEDRHSKHNMFSKNATTFVQYNMNNSDPIADARTLDTTRPLRFGFIGNIIPTKGLEVLIRSCNKLEHDNWALEIAGTGGDDFVSSLKALASDNMNFLGWSDAHEFYKNIDVLICPSTYHDPLPRVIYEAYKAGLPVIASDTGGNPEIIEHGKTGYCYPAYDTDMLAKYLQKFLGMTKEDYKGMSEASIKKAEIFEPKNIIAQYEKKIMSDI